MSDNMLMALRDTALLALWPCAIFFTLIGIALAVKTWQYEGSSAQERDILEGGRGAEWPVFEYFMFASLCWALIIVL